MEIIFIIRLDIKLIFEMNYYHVILSSRYIDVMYTQIHWYYVYYVNLYDPTTV